MTNAGRGGLLMFGNALLSGESCLSYLARDAQWAKYCLLDAPGVARKKRSRRPQAAGLVRSSSRMLVDIG